MFEVSQEQFSGPLDLLLRLVEEKQLEITKINLAQVTNDFVSHVESMDQGTTSSVLADFIVVASKLILIKSKVLLPSLELTQEEEEDLSNLEYRLKLYKEFKGASIHIQKLWDLPNKAHSKKLLSSLGDQSFFYPPDNINAQTLLHALQELATVLKGLMPEVKTVAQNVITLQQKIEELSTRLSSAISFSLKGKASVKDRQEVIVSFLAILHMLAGRLAHVEQTDQFGDIIIRQAEADSA